MSVGGPQASANGNHDNPVSGNHPGTVTLNTQWKIDTCNTHLEGGEGREGWEQSFLRNCTHGTTRAKWLTSTGEL